MQKLFAIFRSGALMKDSLEDRDTTHLSVAMGTQLYLIISKAIFEVEASVLAEIDKLVYDSEGIGRRNPLALWVCLWTLILSYKDHMVFSQAYYGRSK